MSCRHEYQSTFFSLARPKNNKMVLRRPSFNSAGLFRKCTCVCVRLCVQWGSVSGRWNIKLSRICSFAAKCRSRETSPGTCFVRLELKRPFTWAHPQNILRRRREETNLNGDTAFMGLRSPLTQPRYCQKAWWRTGGLPSKSFRGRRKRDNK